MPTTEKWPLRPESAYVKSMRQHRQSEMGDELDELRIRLAAAESERDRYRAALEFIHAQTTGSWQSDPDVWMDAIRETVEKALEGGDDE